MDNITGNNILCCEEEENKNLTTDSIVNSGNITTNSLNSTTGTITTLSCDSITSKDYKYQDADANVYSNLNISYNSTALLFYSWIPQSPNNWWELQNNVSRTVLKVPNDNIRVGSTFHLSMGLEIKDITQASPNIVDFALKLGNGTIAQLGFSTEPPKNLTPTIVSLNCDIVCTAKTIVAPLEYDFVIKCDFVENNNNQNIIKTYNKSSLIQSVPYVVGNDNFMNFMYRINGSNGFTTYERGVYRLYQTI
jgi:hypothetical protein